MGRQPCCHERQDLKKGPWSADEDRKLVAFISSHGLTCWREVPKLAGLMRCGKSCRLRWINYLRPDLKRGMLSPDEENLIIHLHASYGNKWSRIAAQLPGRTDNEIKNCWNTRIKKKLQDLGIDPVTHKPLSEMTHVNATSKSQRPIPGVNAPPTLGHPSLPHLDTSAYHHNMMAIDRLQEGLLGTSPSSVISPQITTSLSHATPTTNCEDEQSMDCSVDSVNHDCSFISNVQANVDHFASEEMFRGDPHMMFTCQHSGNQGLHNAPHMLSTCRAPIRQQVFMRNPPHTLIHNAAHMHHPSPMLQNASHIPPLMICESELRDSHPVQPRQHVLTAYQFQGSQASLPTSKIEGGGITSSSSRIHESNDGCNEGIEVDASAMKEEDECVMDVNCARNVSPYFSQSSTKYHADGRVPEASQLYELNHGEATRSTSVPSTQGGECSNTMLDMLFTEQGEVGLEARGGMRPLLYETSQALGQQNLAAACNPLNVGQWSNIDCLWGDPTSSQVLDDPVPK